MVDYYDWILISIGVLLAAGMLVGVATAVPVRFAVAGSVLAATPFVYDALFRNPPVPAADAGRTVAAVTWHLVLVWTILWAVG